MDRVSATELVWKHTLRASPTVVFDAYTKPELVKRWWAPRSHRVVYTAAMAPLADEIIATVTFTEKNGMTELVSREVYPSKKFRDEAIASGMESGALETMDLLAELVTTL